MNADTQRRLKTHVERIVRPILGEESDKLRMREELFAHALDAYEHEAASGADAETAARRAAERLGDPDATRAELQATVSWISRFTAWEDRTTRRPEGTPVWRHAAKIALGALVLSTCFLAVFALFVASEIIEWTWTGQATLRAMAGMIALESIAAFVAVMLGHQACLVMRKASWALSDYLALGLIVIATAATIGVLGYVFNFAITLDAATSLGLMPRWLPVAVVLSPGVLLAAWVDARERRKVADWLALDLNDAIAE